MDRACPFNDHSARNKLFLVFCSTNYVNFPPIKADKIKKIGPANLYR